MSAVWFFAGYATGMATLLAVFWWGHKLSNYRGRH